MVYGHFYGNFTDNRAHAQSVCTRPFLPRREGPGDEASVANKRGVQKSRFVALVDREKHVRAQICPFFADFDSFVPFTTRLEL